MREFMEANLPTCALLPIADAWDTSGTTDVYNMKMYDRITFILIEGAGGTGTVKIEVEECTSAAGAGNTAIAYKYKTCASAGTADTWSAWTAQALAGYTTVAGANKMVAIEIRANELSAGSNYVRLALTEVANNPCAGCIVAILSEPTYAESPNLTAIV